MRTLTDIEMGSVVGGDLAGDLKVIGDFIKDVCGDNGVEEAEVERGGSDKGLSVADKGVNWDSGDIKITFRCRPGASNSSDEGNDDEDEDAKADESDE